MRPEIGAEAEYKGGLSLSGRSAPLGVKGGTERKKDGVAHRLPSESPRSPAPLDPPTDRQTDWRTGEQNSQEEKKKTNLLGYANSRDERKALE